MIPYYQGKATIYHGDCREILPTLSDFSAVVTDPPYELGFMGKSWDSQGVSFQKETWEIIRKSCLSGAPLLSFGGSRTQHRIACAIEDAGWEIRDTLMWVYGSGFPKSLDISKAIDKDNGKKANLRNFTKWFTEVSKGKTNKEIDDYLGLSSNGATASHYRCIEGEQPRFPRLAYYYKLKEWLGFDDIWDSTIEEAEREVIEKRARIPVNDGTGNDYGIYGADASITAPATPEAKLWEGYGTALKPAYEPIILAMNPLDGTFTNNALKHKVAGLNIDGCRVELTDECSDREQRQQSDTSGMSGIGQGGYKSDHKQPLWSQKGRFPANFLHDGSQMVMELFPNSKPTKPHKVFSKIDKYEGWGSITRKQGDVVNYDETDYSAARFFYTAKASFEEREKGLIGDIPCHKCGQLSSTEHQAVKDGVPQFDKDGKPIMEKCRRNVHPTVKALALMEYLCKLVKMPEYNLILDPFCGSGTTLLACIKLGIPCIGIDSDEQSCEIAARRCSQEVMDFSNAQDH